MRRIFSASLFLSLMFVTCSAISDEIKNWNSFINKIEDGNNNELLQLPGTVNKIGGSLNEEKSAELIEAIGFALVKKPLLTLTATNKISMSNDTLIQRFDTESACSLPLIMSYTRESTIAYYSRATISLTQAGKPAEKCLSIMKSSMEEVNSYHQQGKMVWGNKKYAPLNNP